MQRHHRIPIPLSVGPKDARLNTIITVGAQAYSHESAPKDQGWRLIYWIMGRGRRRVGLLRRTVSRKMRRVRGLEDWDLWPREKTVQAAWVLADSKMPSFVKIGVQTPHPAVSFIYSVSTSFKTHPLNTSCHNYMPIVILLKPKP